MNAQRQAADELLCVYAIDKHICHVLPKSSSSGRKMSQDDVGESGRLAMLTQCALSANPMSCLCPPSLATPSWLTR